MRRIMVYVVWGGARATVPTGSAARGTASVPILVRQALVMRRVIPISVYHPLPVFPAKGLGHWRGVNSTISCICTWAVRAPAAATYYGLWPILH